jgi:hypothetical protein
MSKTEIKEAARLTGQATEFLTLRKEEEFLLSLKKTVNDNDDYNSSPRESQ